MSTRSSVNVLMLYLFTLMLHFPLLLNARSSVPLSHKWITRIMGMCKCGEKHNPTIAHFCLWQPPHHASHTVLSPSFFLHCLDHSIILSLLISPMLPCCAYTISLSLHDPSALFMLSSSYPIISMYAFLSITLTNFPSSIPSPHQLFISVLFFLKKKNPKKPFSLAFSYISFLTHSLSLTAQVTRPLRVDSIKYGSAVNYELLAKVTQPVHQYFYISRFSASICPCFFFLIYWTNSSNIFK